MKRILQLLFAVVILIGGASHMVARAQVIATKIITNPEGNSLEIAEWDDGLKRHKYSVIDPKTPTAPRWWFAQNGSANAGKNEAGRTTSTQDWCRVRYLYGDDVRVPECWGSFMYSSHLITGIDGMHYELWFSPSSLSYFKIRNQESGVWYAHDGSANNGRQKTSKEDWCRVIFYHMIGIIKLPEECKDTQAKIVNSIAKTYGNTPEEKARNTERELSIVALMMGEPGKDGYGTGKVYTFSGEPVQPKGPDASVVKVGKDVKTNGYNFGTDPSAATEAGKKTGLGAAQSALEEGYSAGLEKVRGSIPFDKFKIERTSGPKWTRPMADDIGNASKLGKGGQFLTGVGVGIAVDYGVDAIKNAAGWKAKDANAGMIAAEAVTTTVASSAITTAILTVAGASFNPVTAGVGLLIAGGFAAGEEIAKASKDTGIRFEANYTKHPRYNRDLNGISATTFAPRLLDGTYRWEECSGEGGRCEFNGYRVVLYGNGTNWDDKTALGAIDCGAAAFGGQVKSAPGNRCVVPIYRGENINWTDCAGDGEPCKFAGTRTVAYGVDDKWAQKTFKDGIVCNPTAFGGDPAPGKAKRCAVFLSRDEVPMWIACGGEGEQCKLPGARVVRYGAKGKFKENSYTNQMACDYRTIGDPIPGVTKGCEVLFTAGELRSWTDCAGEGQRCAFTGVRVVRYGAAGKNNFRLASDGIDCSVAKLGDPAPRVAKRCWVQTVR